MKICFRFWPNTVISEGSNPPPHRAASRNGVMGDQTAMAKAQSRVRACPSVCGLLRFAAPRHSTPIVPSNSVAPTETPRESRLTLCPPDPPQSLAVALFYIIAWGCASSGLIFLNSYLLNQDGFHYPMTLCSMGLGASWTISSVLVNSGVCKLEKSKDVSLRWYVRHVVPIGFFASFSLALGNYTYLFLSVSFIQMLKAAVPCVTMIVLVGAGLEKPHRVTVLGVAILTFGTALAAYGEIAFAWIGVLMMLASEFSEACRMAVLQYLLGNLRFELVEGLYVMAPASFGFLAVGILIFERRALMEENGLGKILQSPHKYACAAFLGFLVNLLTLAVIKSTSSLTFKVMGQVKNTLVILVSVVLLGSAITGTQVVGYLISMIGFAVYQRGKQVQTKEETDDLLRENNKV